jgi:hypothetical protein
VNRTIDASKPVVVDPHYSPQFYAELWGMSPATVVRWFQDMDGVLKLGEPSKNGKRAHRVAHSVFGGDERIPTADGSEVMCVPC